MLKRIALCLCLLFAPAANADTPWAAALSLRSETGRVERLLYREPSAARDAEVAQHRSKAMAAWMAANLNEPTLAVRMQAWNDAVLARDAAKAARARQALWLGVTALARDRALAAVAAGDAVAAGNWLTLRDYAEASGDTAATRALLALANGSLSPDAARSAVEAELLTTAASELRLAVAQAQTDAAAAHAIQYAGDLGRIEGLLDYLSGNIRTRLGPEAMSDLTRALKRAEGDPTALGQLAEGLTTYAPIAMEPAEVTRRAQLLRRFTQMIGQEYALGVKAGVVTLPAEFAEAQVFHDRALAILSDLVPHMPDRFAAQQLTAVLGRIATEMAVKSDRVQAGVDAALGQIDRAFGAAAAQGGYQAALESLPLALEDLLTLARAGDWAAADLKRLEAYSWYDPDIEGRLAPRDPTAALRLETRFWEGSATRPGLGALIAARDLPGLETEVRGLKDDLSAATAKIATALSAPALVLQSAAILFREGLEAVLILAALLAALRTEGLAPARFRPAITLGVGLALSASLALWVAAGWLIALSTLAREALEGGTALLAAVVLIWMVTGLSGSGGHVAAMRARLAGAASPASVGVLAFLVVFREGFETVLFYEALLTDAAPLPVLGGLVLGAGAALGAGWAVLASGRKLPLRALFRVTTVLLAALAVMLTGAGLRGLQTAALIPATPVGWFPDRDALQLWFGLYPIAEPLAAQVLVLAVILWALRLRPRPVRGRGAA